MLDRLKRFIAERHLFGKQHNVLLAVSGGMDSVVMTHLFADGGFKFGIAHCNFGLRGAESDEDERFVKSLAEQLAVPFFSQRFDTGAVGQERGISIQMTARELRYQWLEETRQQNGFTHVATAHHLYDSVETAIHNFIRGTGIRGLRGMLPKTGKLIRPILFAKRSEIAAYAAAGSIAFREDTSNVDPKYTRNRIRHEVIPLMRAINPGFDNSMVESLTNFRDAELIYEQTMQRLRKRLLDKRHSDWYIPVIGLKKLPYGRSVLFELIRDFGFNISQVDDILHSLDGPSGKMFEAEHHRLVKDRRFLIISSRDIGKSSWMMINLGEEVVQADGVTLRLMTLSSDGYTIDHNPAIASLDVDAVEFPLTLRKWKPGDYFFPFGMKGKKKVSKFFKDEKIPIPDKERTWILLSGDRVVWVVGHRIDNRFRITEKTKNVCRLEVIT